MKTTFLKPCYFILLALLCTISCNTDDDRSPEEEMEMEQEMDPMNVSNLDLTFTLHTQQDQIGDFAFNEMAVFSDQVHSYYGARSGATDAMPFDLGVWHSDNGIAWASDSSFSSERRGHSLTEFDGNLFLIGGADNDDNELDDVWISSNGFDWTEGTDNLGFGLSFHSTVAFNNQLFIITDNHEDNDGTPIMAVYRSSDGLNWERIAEDMFPIRTASKTVVFDNKIYLIGGTNDTNFLNDIWTTEDGIIWTEVTPSSSFIDPIVFHTLTVYEDALWLVGGWSNTTQFNNHIWYSQDGMNWINYNGDIPFDGLYAHSTLVYEDELWIFGGVQEDGLSGAIGSIKLNN